MWPSFPIVMAGLLVLAISPRPTATQFTASVNPIPPAALELTYKADQNKWLFVDQYAMPYERMMVQLCVSRDAAHCSLASEHVTDTCARLATLLSSPAWQAVDATPDPCLNLSRVEAFMRSEGPNSLSIENNLAALRAFDLSPPSNSSDGKVVLRVRFVYVQTLGAVSAHVHASAYEIVMRPLQDTPESVVVQTECGARGLRSPHSRLAPSLGGSVLEVVVLNNTGTSVRVCVWQCVLPYLKMPWNAPAFPANTSTARQGSCTRAPVSFSTVALSIPLINMTALTFDASRDMLLGVDRFAESIAASLLAQFGPVRVLVSLRGSTYNARQVQEVLDWTRRFRQNQAFDVVLSVNADFTLKNAPGVTRRLLQQSGIGDSFLDIVLVAATNLQTSCCLADIAKNIPKAFEASSFDFGTQTVALGEAQVESSASITERRRMEEATPEQVTRRAGNNNMSIWLPIVLVLIVAVACLLQPK